MPDYVCNRQKTAQKWPFSNRYYERFNVPSVQIFQFVALVCGGTLSDRVRSCGEDETLIDMIGRQAAAHNKLFVVTLGADDSRAFQGSDSCSCPAVPVDEVVDTTGAADAFAAGFFSQYCYEASVSASLMKGALLSADIIQRAGAN